MLSRRQVLAMPILVLPACNDKADVMAEQWQSIANGSGGVDISDGSEQHIFFMRGTATPAGPGPDQWHTFDVRDIGIPADAKCVDISGILIITMGTTPGFTNLCITFKDPLADQPIEQARQELENPEAALRQPTIRGSYVMQCVANTNDGMRSNANTTVTLRDGKFAWGWWHSGIPLGWPTWSAVGANLSITKWWR